MSSGSVRKQVLVQVELLFALFQAIPLLLLIYLPVIWLAGNFQQFYLQTSSLLNPLTYIWGYICGVTAISFSLYLSFMTGIDKHTEEEKNFSSKFSVTIAGAGLIISSIRWMPILLEKIGIGLKVDTLASVAIDVVYFLPAIAIFLLFRNLSIFKSMTVDGKFLGNFKTLPREIQEELEDGQIPERIPPLTPQKISEGVKIFLQLALLAALLGVGTYLIEYFLPKITLLQVFVGYFAVFLVRRILHEFG